jgi:hypothetical protein
VFPATILRRLALGLGGLLLLAAPARAQTPMTSGGVKGVWHWAKGTKIKLWVPPDPDGLAGRRDALIDGIKSWVDQEPLKSLGITIDVVTTEPTGTDGVLRVSWAAAGSGGDEQGGALPAVNQKNEITFARIDIDRSIDTDFAYNLGQHEMGHALGLKDSKTKGDVMYGAGIKPSGKATFTKDDLKELSAAYAAAPDLTHVQVVASVTPVGPLFRYGYTATWLDGGSLAVFQVDTHGAPITAVEPPPGWMVDDFALPPNVTPTFVGGPRDELFVSFIHATDRSYLDERTPVLTFSFESPNAPGPAEAFLAGRFATIGPTASVPEPKPLVLLASGLALVAAVGGRVAVASRRSTADHG